MHQDLSVLPGENWFFYWRLTQSLWKSKIEEISGDKVFIPLNWSFHSETGEDYDFGEMRPEANLLLLCLEIRACGKNPVLFLFLGPQPFAVNGGLPALLARIPALNSNQTLQAFMDNEGSINRFYSFYDPRVFRAFIGWTAALKAEFQKLQELKVAIIAIQPGYLNKREFVPFIRDYSSAFETAFSRFVRGKKAQENGTEEFINFVEEGKLRAEFEKSIIDLYEEAFVEKFFNIGASTEEAYNDQYLDKKQEFKLDHIRKVVFLASHPSYFMGQAVNLNTKNEYVHEMIYAQQRNLPTSSSLISNEIKKGIVGRFIKDTNSNTIYGNHFISGLHSSEHDHNFHSLNYLTWYMPNPDFVEKSELTKHGLLESLNHLKGENFRILGLDKFQLDDENLENTFSIFQIRDLDSSMLSRIIKLFMFGGNIILEMSDATEDQKRKINLFMLENKINVEKIQFGTQIENAVLGEGRLLMVNLKIGDLAANQINFEDKLQFWIKILNTFEFTSFKLERDGELQFKWWTKIPNFGDLNFEEIRRLGCYNATSYKKKLVIPIPKNFALTKIVDDLRAQVSTKQGEIEMTLLPGGHVFFDFGRFA